MAKAKAKQAKGMKRLQAAVQDAAKKPESQPQAPNVSTLKKPVLLITGGSAKAPVKTDVSSVPAVQPDELKNAGTFGTRVQRGLAANLLAGTALSRDVLSKDHDCWQERSLRTDKMAFFGLLDLTAAGKMTVEQLREAWNLSLKERKRYDAPTLQALFKAAKQFLILGGAVEPRISPMARFARGVLEILNNRTLTTDEILRQIRTKMEERAEWPEATQAAPAAAAA